MRIELPCPTIPDSAMHRLTAAFSCVCSLGFHCSIVSPSRVHSCMAWLKLLLLSTSPLFAGGVRPGSLLKESQELPIPELSRLRATLNDYLDKNTFVAKSDTSRQPSEPSVPIFQRRRIFKANCWPKTAMRVWALRGSTGSS